MSATPAKLTPIGCIKRPGIEDVYCSRYYTTTQFTFSDPAYAVKIYAKNDALRACPECVAKVPKELV